MTISKDLQGFENLGGLEPKLTVRTRSGNGKVHIEIEDNGPGIPDEIKDKIMQPFFTTKKGTQGTGLGLSITNDIVKAHGGTMSVETCMSTTLTKDNENVTSCKFHQTNGLNKLFSDETLQGSGTTFTIELICK